jgi:hypothetical protein
MRDDIGTQGMDFAYFSRGLPSEKCAKSIPRVPMLSLTGIYIARFIVGKPVKNKYSINKKTKQTIFGKKLNMVEVESWGPYN